MMGTILWRRWLWRLFHPRFEHLISFLDGELPREIAAEVRVHLANCSMCQERLNGAKSDLRMANRILPDVVLEPSEYQRRRQALLNLERLPATERGHIKIEELEVLLGISVAPRRHQTHPLGGSVEGIGEVLTAFLGRQAAAGIRAQLDLGI